MKKIEKKQSLIAVLVAFAALTLTVIAPGLASADLASGSLSSADGGIILGGKWTSATLSWNISYNAATNTWHYVYTWNPTGAGNLSHFMLQVTEGSKPGEFFNFVNSSLSSGDPKLYTNQSNPNWDMPFDLFGMKLQSASGGAWGEPISQTFSFDSYHSPTLGNFYAQDGRGTFGYNDYVNGIYAAVPDGMVTKTPIPAAAWLLGSGLLGLIAIRRKYKW